MSPERADVEMKATRLLIEAVTDHSTILFRAPYNADSEPQTFEEIEPLARSKKDNYITVGESIDPNDWDAREQCRFYCCKKQFGWLKAPMVISSSCTMLVVKAGKLPSRRYHGSSNISKTKAANLLPLPTLWERQRRM